MAGKPNVIGVQYDPESLTLAITFHRGDVYVYSGVPPLTGWAMQSGDDQFFRDAIYGQYPYRRM